MNSERRWARRLLLTWIMFIIALIVIGVFVGLYIDQKQNEQDTYNQKFTESLSLAADEIDTYIEKQADYQLRYNMVLSDLGSARTMSFMIDDNEDNQKTINEIHYAFVKYPQQMQTKLEDCSKAFRLITEGYDEGYDQLDEIINSLDKKGN